MLSFCAILSAANATMLLMLIIDAADIRVS